MSLSYLYISIPCQLVKPDETLAEYLLSNYYVIDFTAALTVTISEFVENNFMS